MGQPTAGFMTHVTCRLTAKNRDQLRNSTLGSRVWATFTFLLLVLQVRLYYNQANEVLLSTDLSVSHLQPASDLHQHSALSYDQL